MRRTVPAVRAVPTDPDGGAGGPATPLLFLIDGRGTDVSLRQFTRTFADSLGTRYVSRSYSWPFALIAAHDERVGVDIERASSWTEAQARSVLTPDEQAGRVGPVEDVTSVWSAKEALAKALGDALAYDPRRLAAPCWWPGGVAGRWRARPVTVPADHVGWLCWTN